MTDRVAGDPRRLEAYSDVGLAIVAGCRPTVDDYSATVQAAAAAPNDLGNELLDLSQLAHETLDVVEEMSRAPAAFAFALRHLDQLTSWQIGDAEAFAALAGAALRRPDGTVEQIVAAAGVTIEHGWRSPFGDDGFVDWLRGETSRPSFLIGTPILGALETVWRTERAMTNHVPGYVRANGTPVRGYQRWNAGWADRMNRITSANNVARAAPAARRLGTGGSFAVPAAVQLWDDRDDPTLHTGDRVVRTTVTGVSGGGGALALGLAGAAAGSAILPGPGTVIGGVLGGAAGGLLGTGIGDAIAENARGTMESLGDGAQGLIDGVKGWFG